MEPVQPDAVKQALNTIDWPASKQDVVAHAENASGSDDVVRALRSLPLADYANVDEVLRGLPQPG